MSNKDGESSNDNSPKRNSPPKLRRNTTQTTHRSTPMAKNKTLQRKHKKRKNNPHTRIEILREKKDYHRTLLIVSAAALMASALGYWGTEHPIGKASMSLAAMVFAAAALISLFMYHNRHEKLINTIRELIWDERNEMN